MQIILFIPVLFFSIVLHEFAHGFVAYKLGDMTAYSRGRLTLNPLKHIDIMGTLLVPLFCYMMHFPMFGWAKPVPVNPMQLPSPRKDMGKVAVAGPAVNLALAIICVLLLKCLLLAQGFIEPALAKQLAMLLQYGMLVNVLLMVFNLLPIVPLDGGRIVTALLPPKAAWMYDTVLSRFGMWIVILLVLTGAVRYLIFPSVYFIVNLLTKIL